MDSLRSGRSRRNTINVWPQSRVSPVTFTAGAALLLTGVVLSGGCASLRSPFPTPKFASSTPSTERANLESANDKRTSNPTNRLVSFVTGKKEDISLAQQMYQKAHATYMSAKKAPKNERAGLYSDAADQFRDAASYAPPALIQDAMFMQGECLFMADELTSARDVFEKLQKDYPRNRHSDRAAARLFQIGKYWIAVDEAGGEPWSDWLNPFDAKVPWADTAGHAVKVLDQIRFDDPTGRLADDATMAAAAELIRQEKYDEADEFLTDLRETFTDSNHLFLAHMLGIRCKLEVYAGPHYSGAALEEAEKLIRQTRQRFPREAGQQKYAEMLARAAAEVSFLKAEKLATRANYREKRGEYRAARQFYNQILRDHPKTPQAETARKRLGVIADYAATPPQRLAFLTTIFPDARQTAPLETIENSAPEPQGTGPQGTGPQETGAPTQPESGGSFFR